MTNQEGINGIRPVIKKIAFEQKGKISLYLEDGRIVIVPLSLFPSIKKLPEAGRKKWHVSDDEIIMFEDCDEVFHIEQFLGREQDYKYSFVKQ